MHRHAFERLASENIYCLRIPADMNNTAIQDRLPLARVPEVFFNIMQKEHRRTMATQSRSIQDRRNSSRIITVMDCRMEYNNSIYDAVIVDISPKGALISSPCLPYLNGEVKISIKSKHLKKELTLYGNVLRGSEVMTEHGKRGRFSVGFYNSPLDLLVLIGKLHAA